MLCIVICNIIHWLCVYHCSSTITVYSARGSTSCAPITQLSIKRHSFAISCPRWTAQTRPNTLAGNYDVTTYALLIHILHFITADVTSASRMLAVAVVLYIILLCVSNHQHNNNNNSKSNTHYVVSGHCMAVAVVTYQNTELLL